MKIPRIIWPTLLQWIFIFVVATWLTAIVCTGVVISIFCRMLRIAVIPSILIAFLAAQPVLCDPYFSMVDPEGNVTMVAQISTDLKSWDDCPWKVVVHVDRATMVGSEATVYSNEVMVASFELPPPIPDVGQVIDVSSWMNLKQLGEGSPACFAKWRVPVYELGLAGVGNGTDSLIVVMVCGCAVIVLGGISVYNIVKLCNRIEGTNAPPLNP